MRFANPDAFQFLWLIPVLLLASIAFEYRARNRIAKALGGKLTQFLASSASPTRRWIKLALKTLALVFFVLALARPQTGKSLQEVTVKGVEMVIAFDVSTSMLAEDVKPSRLQHAKAEISRLLDLLVGDKVGLVAFAGSSALLSPLTTDKSALKLFIDSLSTESVETQGTNVTKALLEARSAFERGGVESDETTQVTRVILVASDGEDQDEGALEEARKLVKDGTRIFSLAFGTEQGGQIPIRDERGFLRNYKRDQSGENVVSKVKGDFLRKLAEVGNGSFHHASFGGQEARLIKADLEKLQQAEFSSSIATNFDERYQIPLAIGFLLALLEMFISERRRAKEIWKGRFEVNQ